MAFQKPKTNWKKWITSAQDLLHNAKQEKRKNVYLLPVSHLCYTTNIFWPHFLCYDESKMMDQLQASTRANSRLLRFTKWYSQIKHTQHLHSMSWRLDNAGWVWRFRRQRHIKTRKVWVHKISFTTQNITKARMSFFACL